MTESIAVPWDKPTETIMGYTRHPASAALPDQDPEEYAALLESIRDSGQDHPISVTPDNLVFDGWHRLRACAELNLPVLKTIYHLTDEEIASKVIGTHTGRRHMTKTARAQMTIAVMKACGMVHAPENRPAKGVQNEPLSGPVITRETVARDANVSEATARRAISEDKKTEQGQSVEAPADGVKRKANVRAQSAKAKREAAFDDRLAIMQEILEHTANRAHAVEIELAARDSEDNEHYDEALARISQTP